MWTALSISAALSVLVFCRWSIAVGVGCAFGTFIGGAICLATFRMGNGIDFQVIGKGAVCGALLGASMEVAFFVFGSDRAKKEL